MTTNEGLAALNLLDQEYSMLLANRRGLAQVRDLLLKAQAAEALLAGVSAQHAALQGALDEARREHAGALTALTKEVQAKRAEVATVVAECAAQIAAAKADAERAVAEHRAWKAENTGTLTDLAAAVEAKRRELHGLTASLEALKQKHGLA